MANIAACSEEYHRVVTSWKEHQSFVKKESKVGTAVTTAERFLSELKTSLCEVANIKVVTTNLANQLKSSQEKLLKMLMMLPVVFNSKDALEQAIPLLHGCIRAQKQRKSHKLSCGHDYTVVCSNTLGLSWDCALENIEELELKSGATSSNVKFSPLNAEQLRFFTRLKDRCRHEGLICIPGVVLSKEYGILVDDKSRMQETVYQLIEFFPLLGVEKCGYFILLDYTEIVNNPGLVNQVLMLDQTNSKETDQEQDSPSQAKEGIMFLQKPEPISMQQKYPQLLTVMMDYIKLHGLAAHARRRTGTSTSCGVHLEDIRQNLLMNVDGLTTISKSKVYNLLQPARSNTAEAARHKDAVDVRTGGVKACDMSKENRNAHEYFASVEYIRQMCAEYPQECLNFSCDSKAKIHIGGQAVTRHHQLRTFFPSGDCPHYMVIDFPVPGYLIEPHGYLHLRSMSEEIVVTNDKLDREVVDTPSSGPLFVYNRCVKNTSTSIMDHLSDISDIFEKHPTLKKPVLALTTDGGPNWTPKSNINQFFLGRFWHENDFDMLVIACYAPGLSQYNPIEHKWFRCSKWLAGVSLPACLLGENVPPAQQFIEVDEKAEKERMVIKNALDKLNSYWNGKVHNSFKVISVGVNDDDVVPRYKDYTDVKEMFGCSLRAIKSNPSQTKLLEEWRYLVKHMDKRWGLVCFRKGSCGDIDCKCMETGIQATDVMKIPYSDRWSLPPITPDPENPGHYKTFRQQLPSLVFSQPDEHLKEVMIESCSKCKYVFTSGIDRNKHAKLVHGGVRNMANMETDSGSDTGTSTKKVHKCGVCDNEYPTRYQLLKHQEDQGHKLKRGRPSGKKD